MPSREDSAADSARHERSRGPVTGGRDDVMLEALHAEWRRLEGMQPDEAARNRRHRELLTRWPPLGWPS